LGYHVELYDVLAFDRHLVQVRGLYRLVAVRLHLVLQRMRGLPWTELCVFLDLDWLEVQDVRRFLGRQGVDAALEFFSVIITGSVINALYFRRIRRVALKDNTLFVDLLIKHIPVIALGNLHG